MEKAVLKVLFAALIFEQVIAAPNEAKLEDIAEVVKAEDTEKVDTPTLLDDIPGGTTAPQSLRQKRWYDYYAFPPLNPFYNRDDSINPGGFGQQDPLVYIHRRLQDIRNSFRQPVPPPPPPQFPPGFPQFPTFVPFFYIPQVGCNCLPGDTPQSPIDNRPVQPQDNDNNGTTTAKPDVANRWPEMEDERQNWGLVPEDNLDEGEGDGSRPISFDPIRPNIPNSRPAPPVEHGSVDGSNSNGNSVNSGTTTTTVQPAQAPSNSGLQPPSNCDSAILRCCHMPQVSYDCFAYQGCPDPSSYGNPCESGVISRVIDRFLKYYNQRNG